MKKTTPCILILIMVYASCAYKYNSESDFQVSLLDDGKSAEITDYTGGKQIVSIPPVIHGMKIVRIGNDAFKKKEILGVIIPDSVTSIGNRAFAYNPLTSITIPSGVTEIGEGAFAYCNNLNTGIAIPSSVKSIGRYAFFHCRNLPSITIPSSVKAFGEMAFYDWNILQTINILGFDSQTAADNVWQASWRDGCKAKIYYKKGE